MKKLFLRGILLAIFLTGSSLSFAQVNTGYDQGEASGTGGSGSGSQCVAAACNLHSGTTSNSQTICQGDKTGCGFLNTSMTFGTGSTFTHTFDAGATDPYIIWSSGAADFYGAWNVHGVASSLVFANNMYINGDTARKLKIGSTGGTYNNDLFIDNDTTNHTITFTSSNGTVLFDLGTIGLKNTALTNVFGNVSIGTTGTPASTLSSAGNVSIGTAYAVAHAAPTNGAIIQGNVGIGTWSVNNALEVVGNVNADSYTTTGSGTGSVGIGTTLQTSGLAVMSGNVGVGTWLPTQPLQVKGVIESTTGGFKFPDGTTQTTAGGGGSSLWATQNTTDQSLAGGNVGIGTTATTTAALTVMNGNAGIGTWSPTQKLQVVGTVAATAFTGDGSGLTGISSAGGGWIDGGTNMYQSATTDTVGIGTTTPLSTFDDKGSAAFGTYGGTVAAPSNGVIISGNVGIGTSVAGSRSLHVAGSSTSLYTNTLANTSTAGISLANLETSSTTAAFAPIQFQFRNSSNTLTTEAWIAAVAGSHSAGAESTNLAFGTRTGGTNAEAFRIQGGSVGIGTTQLSNKLAVSGAQSVGAGTLYINTAAPTNGMIIQGNVGIGTWIPTSPLSIYGTTVMQKLTATNQACSTTCGAFACFFGEDTGVIGTLGDCADATMDVCFCSK